MTEGLVDGAAQKQQQTWEFNNIVSMAHTGGESLQDGLIVV